MKKTTLILTLIAIAITLTLTNTTTTAQIYHEDCKEDLRAFFRQGKNFEKVGLTITDTITWYDNEEWVEKVSNIKAPWGSRSFEVNWNNTDSLSRIREFISERNPIRDFEGKLTLRSPDLSQVQLRNNSITVFNTSNNQKLRTILIDKTLITKLDFSNQVLEDVFISYNPILSELIWSDKNSTFIFDCWDNPLLTELDFVANPKAKIVHLKLADNSFARASIVTPSGFSIQNNCLKFSTLPLIVITNNATYAPQATIFGAAIHWTETIDLSPEYLINNQHITSFEWFDISTGEELPITQPHNNLGVFTFTQEHEGKKLRCKMLNAQFPDLTQIYETDILTGIQEVTPIANLTLFPNPSQTKAVIQFTLLEDNNVTIDIYDLFGNIVYTNTTFRTAGEQTQPLDISDFIIGSYTCLLSAKGQQIGVVNFVVSR